MCNNNYFVFIQTTVLDGKKGLPILDTLTSHSGTVDAPGITLSYSGIGNDVFLFWVAVCVGHENSQEKFAFVKGNLRRGIQIDFCLEL